MVFKEGWVEVNRVPTRVKTWGGWIDDPLPEGDSLIICLPGNPGLTPFYHSFLETLHQLSGIPVWIACHAGHELPPKSTKMKCPQDGKLYDTAGQIAHKLAFIKQYVPANRKLFVIGHSLGAKVVSELLKDSQIAEHTQKCYLLMPTLEKIGDTPNGKFLTSILTYWMTVILLATWVFSLFPHNCRKFLIGCWFMLTRQHNVDEHCMEGACHLTLPKVLNRVFTLALDEMDKIKDLDVKVIDAHCSKLKVYFAPKDGWAPLSYLDSLKAAKPNIDATVLGENFCHTFVLDNPEEMADIIAQQVKKERVKGSKFSI